MVMRLLAIHCEVTTGYRGNRYYSQTKIKLCSDFIGYNGYEATCCIL